MNVAFDTRPTVRATTATDTPAILFLVRSLRRGGAERQLVALATGLHRHGWPVSVACCYGGGAFQAELERAGVPLIDLGKRGRRDVAGFLWRLLRALRRQRPAIVHGYMPLGNMLALCARVACPGARVVWGVRSSLIDRSHRDWLSRLNFRLSRGAAHLANRIIANSEAGAAYHAALGYPRARMQVIPNGIDVGRFRFDATARGRVRREWHIDAGCTLVGLVGRIDPMKDHPTFLAAIGTLAKRHPTWRFVCVGGGQPGRVTAMHAHAQQLGLDDSSLTWAGPRSDLADVYSALDIAVSSSRGEGFSNVIAEAMACERPCVVTDVGDSARIVGDCGVVVPPRDPAALAAGIERLAQALAGPGEAARRGASARARITATYSLDALVRNSERAFRALCDKPGRT